MISALNSPQERIILLIFARFPGGNDERSYVVVCFTELEVQRDCTPNKTSFQLISWATFINIFKSPAIKPRDCSFRCKTTKVKRRKNEWILWCRINFKSTSLLLFQTMSVCTLKRTSTCQISSYNFGVSKSVKKRIFFST